MSAWNDVLHENESDHRSRGDDRTIFRNASGDHFEITRRGSEFYAEQATGNDKNWLGHSALLHSQSLRELRIMVANHWSN